MTFPLIPAGLVSVLAAQYPDKCPRREMSAFDLGVMAGHQQIIDLLRSKYDKQQESRASVHEP